MGQASLVDEPDLVLLCVHDLHLYALGHIRQTVRAMGAGLVWLHAHGVAGEADRAAAHGHIQDFIFQNP